jgi:phosphoadenosine phosphosulfate reductase
MKRKLNIIPQLKPFIDMPFKDKYAITTTIIQRQFREHPGKLAVAWSGGKDSTIVLYLVLGIDSHIPVIFNNTGIEYPETIAFIRDITHAWNLNLIETKPIKLFWQCVDEYGWPKPKRHHISEGNNTGKCCYWMKEKPMKLALQLIGAKGYFTGITAIENRTRMFNARDLGTCYKTDGVIKIHPILYWTSDEVWQYAKENRIRMNDIYTKGAERCGCSCCTAFDSWESQLSVLNPKLYRLVKSRKDHQSVMDLNF